MNKLDFYKIDKRILLGKGKFSEVYLGECINEEICKKYNLKDNKIAVKIINTNNLSQAEFKSLFDEQQVLEKLKNNHHPNIIQIIDIIDEFDKMYIIMEFCENDFSKIIKKKHKENTIHYYFIQILNGLIFLQENNIIHRDIKPKNILLTNNNQNLKISDFSFSKYKNISRSTTICGSPLYMAPELLDKKSYSSEIDIWALGIILYELCFGKNPFAECKDIDELTLLSQQKINIPFNDLSKDCNDLITRLLEIDENKRLKLKDIIIHPWIKKKKSLIKLSDILNSPKSTCSLEESFILDM